MHRTPAESGRGARDEDKCQGRENGKGGMTKGGIHNNAKFIDTQKYKGGIGRENGKGWMTKGGIHNFKRKLKHINTKFV